MSSRLVNSVEWGVAWLPREERKREEVSGVWRLSRGIGEVEWRGREAAEFGGRPPPDIHSPLLMCVVCEMWCARCCVH